MPVPDTTPEFDLFGPGPAPGTAPAASSATASANPFVSEEQAPASAPQAGGSPTGGVAAGGSPETRLPFLSVCCDSHCNRTSR